ncbi:MAG: hypothetical protein A2Y76_10680 [Planctomycetes bacterium RBG_13_60_9]|nr:MAG: hypothetical protein A2Y76_10680 [Planctomycetes bacterium RBG_13_60_9]
MRPEGLEPPTIGSEDESRKAPSHTDTTTCESRQGQLTSQLTAEPPTEAQTDGQSLSADLARIVAAWPKLPEPIKAAIIALMTTA